MAKAVPSLTHLFSKDKVCVFVISGAIFASIYEQRSFIVTALGFVSDFQTEEKV